MFVFFLVQKQRTNKFKWLKLPCAYHELWMCLHKYNKILWQQITLFRLRQKQKSFEYMKCFIECPYGLPFGNCWVFSLTNNTSSKNNAYAFWPAFCSCHSFSICLHCAMATTCASFGCNFSWVKCQVLSQHCKCCLLKITSSDIQKKY